MADSWENITVGMKIEVANTDTDLRTEVYWIATVTSLAGKAIALLSLADSDSESDCKPNVSYCTMQNFSTTQTLILLMRLNDYWTYFMGKCLSQ